MSLHPGTRLGPYEVTAQIGQGGMGEVYRATDTKLKREVAIKILPPSLAADHDRLARFQREAEVLASLNHPNIAAIYGLEDSGGMTALVMELVEGDDLSQRIAQGAIPLDEALPIAKQIAEALEAAHEQGIIHRDLKPANIKVRPDGTVKVLDFGLAKAMEPVSAVSSSASQAPTITTPAMMTGVGMILGTAAYMSPEQARGRTVDRRSDIWAFGCVLYEMLTGQRAFSGEDVTDTLAAVVRSEPAWGALPSGLSPTLAVYLKCCLHKDPKHRIPHIAAMRLALEGAFEDGGAQRVGSLAVAQSLWRRLLPFAAAAVLATVVVGLAAWRFQPASNSLSVNRFAYVVPRDQPFRNPGRAVIALSPDGRAFVYNTTKGFYVRAMGELEAKLIPGTEGGGNNPFFSSDGKSVGYFDGTTGELKRVALTGGGPVVICAWAGNPFGASWGADNTILFGQPEGIMRVSASGSSPELVIRAEEGESIYGPQLLPDGESVLFSATKGTWDDTQVVVESLRTHERTIVLSGGSEARYLSTGHLVYALGDALFAVAFDAGRLRVDSAPVSVVQGVSRSLGSLTGSANYAVSADGTLVYLSDVGASQVTQLTWFNRNGDPQGLVGDRGATVRNVTLAPDENRVAFGVQGRGVWIIDLRRNVTSQLVREGGDPTWSPDGSRVAFAVGASGVSSVPVAGGEPLSLFQTKDGVLSYVEDWHPGGQHLALLLVRGGRDQAVVVGTTGDQAPVVVDEARDLDEPHFSPDGKWIAYNADRDGGGMKVYVVPNPPSGERIQVSASGGVQALWRADGRELFYLTPKGTLMAVAVDTQRGFVPAAPMPLFETELTVASNLDQYAVSRDGRRFLVAVPADVEGNAEPPRIIVVENWLEELKRLVPVN